MTEKYALPPDTEGITFKYSAKQRLLDAAWRIAARDGIRALSTPAMEAESKRKRGTIGASFKIDDLVTHIVEYCFMPLAGVIEASGFSPEDPLATQVAMIDIMLDRDRLVAPGVMQARALAATAAYRPLFQEQRQAAVTKVAAMLTPHLGRADALARGEALIVHYLEACGRAAGTA